MMSLASGSFLISCHSSKSALIVFTPRCWSHFLADLFENVLTATTSNACPASPAALFASAASVGPIFPPAPRINNGLETDLMNSANFLPGRVRSSSNSCSSRIASGNSFPSAAFKIVFARATIQTDKSLKPKIKNEISSSSFKFPSCHPHPSSFIFPHGNQSA